MEDSSVLERSSRPIDTEINYGAHPEHVADVRYGASGSQRPLLIMIHGGFWRPAYDRKHTGPMTEALADAGYTVASIEYRRIPGEPCCTLDDVRSALEILPGKIERHNGNVVVLGHSAGGHLALWASSQPWAKLRAAMPLAPVADLRLADQLNLGDGAVRLFLGDAPEQLEYADPIRLADPRNLVTILQGVDDETVPVEIALSYVKQHPSVKLISIEGAHHYSLIDPASSAWSVLLETLSQFKLTH